MKLIILDRDGVINQESSAFIKGPHEFHPLPGSIEAIARLTQAGYTIVVATNQSGVGRKVFSMQDMQDTFNKLHDLVAAAGGKIYKIYYCPHAPFDNCNCRKPKPGMLEQMSHDLQQDITLLTPPLVGDSVCDMELAINHGFRPFLVTSTGSHGADTKGKLSAEQLSKITVVDNLAEVVDIILNA